MQGPGFKLQKGEKEGKERGREWRKHGRKIDSESAKYIYLGFVKYSFGFMKLLKDFGFPRNGWTSRTTSPRGMPLRQVT